MRDDFDPEGKPAYAPVIQRHPTLKGLGAVAPGLLPAVEEKGSEAISEAVSGFTSQLTAMKQVSAIEAFNALHPDVKRDLVRLCDFVDDPFEFDQQFRLFCLENRNFLAQISILLEKRIVRAKITTFEPADDGWCVEDRLEEIFNPSVRDDVSLHLSKTSGDESRYPVGTVKKIPLRNILPYNLKRNL
jgi:hypothetical protein